VPAVEIAAADLAEGGDDIDFITEHLTEAEVFSKYGLAEKAAEHLRAVLERAPANLTAHERLFRILLEEGDVDAARTAAQAYVEVLGDKGDSATIATVKNEFVSRGERFEPVPLAEPAPSFATESSISIDDFAGGDDEEMSFDLDAPAEIEFDLEPPVAETPEPALALPASLPADEPAISFESETEFDATGLGTIEDLPAEEEIETETVEELRFEEELAPAQPLAEEPVEEFAEEPVEEFAEELTLGQADEDALDRALQPEPDDLFGSISEPAGIFDEAGMAEAIPDSLPDITLPDIEEEPLLASLPEPEADAVEEPFFGVEGLGEPLDIDDVEVPLEEIGEVDFYIEQELFEEARRKLDALQARFPGNADLMARGERIATAVAAAAAAVPRPPVFSRDEIESELLSAIPDDDDDFSVPSPEPVAAPAPAPAISAALVQEENLFADEDNFFDLAAELESELADEEEAISLSEEEQSLEEIFREFKKGVEQQLDSEDYDTHYNLGIAYKEMGLIDEAIGEFQLASKDPKRAVECASMLGLCFLEKGMPQLAIKWYRKGIEMPEVTEDEHVGLLYDLGSAYQEVGDTDNAQKAFMEVYGMNSNYRDIVNRIKQLEDAKR
jgi:tetratricopeptide (TPR) repeat protein